MSPSTNSSTGLKGQVLRWRRRLGARIGKPRLLWLMSDGIDAASYAGQALDLVASERLLQHLVCEPGLPLADAAALQGYARQLFGHYFGAAAQRWPLAGWRSATGDVAGVSALHGIDLLALRQGLEQQQVALRGLRPAWAAVLERQAAEQPDWLRAPRAALAWVEGGLLTWLTLRAGVVHELRHQRLAAATVVALSEALSELMDGETVLLLGYGLDAAQLPSQAGVRQLAPLNGAAPQLEWFERPAQGWAEAPRPDFAADSAPRSRLAWPLAATGLLVLATALWSAWDSRAQWESEQQRVATLAAQLPRPQAVVAAKRTAVPAQAVLEQGEKLRAAGEVQGLLQTPWGPLLAHVEQAGMGESPASTISWLGLDYQAARRELRLDGLASDQALALQLVERLSAAPGWNDVVLSRFQSASEGLQGQRFDLGAKLRPELLRDHDLARVSRSRQDLALQ